MEDTELPRAMGLGHTSLMRVSRDQQSLFFLNPRLGFNVLYFYWE